MIDEKYCYESPIKIIEDQLHNQIITDYENGIMKALMRYPIYVDKEELLKALQYDRGQYDKGYQDGLDAGKWIPCEERLPETDGYILLSLSNFSIPIIGRYEEDSNGGAFYAGDEDETLVSQDMFVNAWQPLPQPYKKGGAE